MSRRSIKEFGDLGILGIVGPTPRLGASPKAIWMSTLFLAQSHDRIQPRRPQRRDGRGDDGHDEEDGGNRHKSRPIRRAHADEHRAHDAGQQIGGPEADARCRSSSAARPGRRPGETPSHGRRQTPSGRRFRASVGGRSSRARRRARPRPGRPQLPRTRRSGRARTGSRQRPDR